MAEPDAITIDPEVEEILRSVASDSNSTLLRVSRPTRLTGFFNRGRGVSAITAGLTPAERHLVRTRRSEVARLLREAGRMKLFDRPEGRLNVSPFRSTGEEHLRWKPEELATCVRENRVGESIPAELAFCWCLLDRCVGAPYADHPSIAQLALASLRLEPTDEARIMAALDLIQGGAPEAGIRILVYVLGAPSSSSVAVSARGNLGMAYSFLGDLPMALAHYSAARRLGGQCLDQCMNCLVFAIQLGRVEEAREAALMIETLALASFAPVQLFSETRSILRRRGNWSPSAESLETIRKLSPCFGPASRRIASVFD